MTKQYDVDVNEVEYTGIKVYDIMSLVDILSESMDRITTETMKFNSGDNSALIMADEISRVAPQLLVLTNVIHDKLDETHSDIYKIVNTALEKERNK